MSICSSGLEQLAAIILDIADEVACTFSAMEEFMNALTVSEARANLYRLMDETQTSHKPVLISGKRNNAFRTGSAGIQQDRYG